MNEQLLITLERMAHIIEKISNGKPVEKDLEALKRNINRLKGGCKDD